MKSPNTAASIIPEVKRLQRQGLKRDEIADRLGVSHGTVDTARALIREGQDQASGRNRVRRKNVANGTTNLRRQRELLEQKRSAEFGKFRQFQAEVNRLCLVLEGAGIEDFPIDDEFTLWMATDVLDDLLALWEWLDRQIEAMKARLSEQELAAKIAKLRNTDGRTPEETKTAIRLAERLERKLAQLAG